MFADTASFFILLIYSLTVGAVLGVFFDILMLAVDFIAPASVKKSNPVVLPHDRKGAEKALYPIDKSIGTRDVLLFFADILFCAVSAFTVIILLYHLNYGEIRAFSLISALAGYIVYRKTLGRPVRFLMKKLLLLVKKTVKIIFIGAHKVLLKLFAPIISLVKRTALPVIQRVRSNNLKKKARKYLILMEEKENKRAKKRDNQNERSESRHPDR